MLVEFKRTDETLKALGEETHGAECFVLRPFKALMSENHQRLETPYW